jgi:hypothetical protein
MLQIPFSQNWNNKLNCSAFTTIRLYNASKHQAGTPVLIVLKGATIAEGKIIAVKPFILASLNEYMAYLDTGYSRAETDKLIRTMYPTVDFTKKQLAFILIVKNK